MRTALIVFLLPGQDLAFCIAQGFKPVSVQAFVPKRAIEGLDKRIVGRLPRTAELDLDFVVVGPEVDDVTGELTAVIAKQRPRNPPALLDTV